MTQEYKYSANYDHPLLAELYDQTVRDADDIELLRRLIGEAGPLSILECFSGTGRLLIPLAQDGHRITGLEIAPSMNARAAEKIARLGEEAQRRVRLRVQDALDGGWGTGYELVIMGANAFYELPSAQAHERCIRFAWKALVPGGRLFVDNDDYKGDWGRGPFGVERVIFQGRGADGTFGRWTLQSLHFDEGSGVLHLKRTWFTRTQEGRESRIEYLGHKHPVSAKEVEGWLRKYGFQILEVFGDRQGNSYTEESKRAIFWAKKV